jgi:hypothetical protein
MHIKSIFVLVVFTLSGCAVVGSDPSDQHAEMPSAPAAGIKINSIIAFGHDIYAYETSLPSEGGRYHASNVKIMFNGEMGDKNYKFLSKFSAGAKFRFAAKFTERTGFDRFTYLLIVPLEGQYSEIRFKYLLGATGSFPVLVE